MLPRTIQTSEQKGSNGFNGLHRGLAIAALVHQMRTLVPADRQLVSVGGRFIRPLTWPILVDADVVRNGGTPANPGATRMTCVRWARVG